MGSKLAEALRKNRERSTKNFLPFFKFPDGKTDIRILPAAKGDDPDNWFLPVGYHYNVDDRRPVTCPYETNWAQEDCPICEVVKEMRTSGMNDEANKISVRRRYLVRGIVRGEEDEGAQIIGLASTLFQAIGELINDEETFGNILSPGGKGRFIRVIKTGKNLDTKYSAQALPKTEPALESSRFDELKDILLGLTPIETLVVVPGSAELEKIAMSKIGFTAGGGMGDSFEEDEDVLAETTEEEDETFDLDMSGDDNIVPEEQDDFFGEEEDDSDVEEDPDAEDPDAWLNSKPEDAKATAKSTVKADLEAELGDAVVTKKRGRTKKSE